MSNIAGALYRVTKITNEMKCSRGMKSMSRHCELSTKPTVYVTRNGATGSETTPPYAPRSSRFCSEPPSVEDDVDIWRYAIVRVACQKRR